MKQALSFRIAALLLLANGQAPALPQTAPAPQGAMAFTERYYSSETQKIPMRDGVALKTEILRPRGISGALPFLLVRTPYGIASESIPARTARFRALAEEGYIFVIQEMRGTASSGGDFTFVPPRAPAGRVDEATDSYDTIDWLLSHVPDNNGRVGVTGCSYPGYAAVMAALSGHPAVKAISPQSPMADMFRGDDIYWNGIPLLAQAPFFAMMMDTRMETIARLPKADAFEWYLENGAIKDVQSAAFGRASPSWTSMLENDSLSPYWSSRDLARAAGAMKVPSLIVTGWYDVEDFVGPMRLFQAGDAGDSGGTSRLVVGPWRHCQWLEPRPGDTLGPLAYGSPTATDFREAIEAPFFAYYLKGKGSLENMPQVIAYETGGGGWRSYDSWPPKRPALARSLYLGPGGTLVDQAPGSEATDSYVSDPHRPVPYARRPIGFFTGTGLGADADRERARSLFIVEDQRFSQDRPDVLTWVSPELKSDLILTGQAGLELFASTTGSDVDWIAQLIDVYPDDHDPVWSGYRLSVSRGALRASLRKGLDRRVAVEPGRTEKYAISLETRNHRFRKGHRIMLQLQSSWFPYLARNPQLFANAAKAGEQDFTTVTNSIRRGGLHASRLILPLAANGNAAKWSREDGH